MQNNDFSQQVPRIQAGGAVSANAPFSAADVAFGQAQQIAAAQIVALISNLVVLNSKGQPDYLKTRAQGFNLLQRLRRKELWEFEQQRNQ